jgi:hypothetical protein
VDLTRLIKTVEMDRSYIPQLKREVRRSEDIILSLYVISLHLPNKLLWKGVLHIFSEILRRLDKDQIDEATDKINIWFSHWPDKIRAISVYNSSTVVGDKYEDYIFISNYFLRISKTLIYLGNIELNQIYEVLDINRHLSSLVLNVDLVQKPIELDLSKYTNLSYFKIKKDRYSNDPDIKVQLPDSIEFVGLHRVFPNRMLIFNSRLFSNLTSLPNLKAISVPIDTLDSKQDYYDPTNISFLSSIIKEKNISGLDMTIGIDTNFRADPFYTLFESIVSRSHLLETLAIRFTSDFAKSIIVSNMFNPLNNKCISFKNLKKLKIANFDLSSMEHIDFSRLEEVKGKFSSPDTISEMPRLKKLTGYFSADINTDQAFKKVNNENLLHLDIHLKNYFTNIFDKVLPLPRGVFRYARYFPNLRVLKTKQFHPEKQYSYIKKMGNDCHLETVMIKGSQSAPLLKPKVSDNIIAMQYLFGHTDTKSTIFNENKGLFIIESKKRLDSPF